MRAVRILVLAAVAACGDEAGQAPDAGGAVDAASPDAAEPDAAEPDAAEPDAAEPDAGDVPLPGFGAITGACGAIDPAALDGDEPRWFAGELTFADRFDDPEDRPLLTAGGLEVLLDGNAGGSSRYSEVFAFEVLARCELAALLATEEEIEYEVASKKADLLVELDGQPVGVSVMRAVTFPFGDPYTLDAATTLLDRKLDDILLARDAAKPAFAWDTSMVVALAFDAQHAQVLMEAWAGLDAATRADTLVVVVVTSGDDLFIYTDR